MQETATKTLSQMMGEMNERFKVYQEKLKKGMENLSAEEIFANHDVWADRVSRGMNAAALDAIKKAYQTGTNLVIWRDEKMVEITPEEAEAEWLESKEDAA
jgi:hypothetical protein